MVIFAVVHMWGGVALSETHNCAVTTSKARPSVVRSPQLRRYDVEGPARVPQPSPRCRVQATDDRVTRGQRPPETRSVAPVT
ncbi:MAG: hypothetical protein ABI873_20235, partial [Marmoricola sp.]